MNPHASPASDSSRRLRRVVIVAALLAAGAGLAWWMAPSTAGGDSGGGAPAGALSRRPAAPSAVSAGLPPAAAGSAGAASGPSGNGPLTPVNPPGRPVTAEEPLPPAGLAEGSIEPLKPWDRDAKLGGNALAELYPRLNECFEKARGETPNLKGRAQVDFYLVPDGFGARVSPKPVVRGSFADTPVDTCMREVLAGGAFPSMRLNRAIRIQRWVEFPSPLPLPNSRPPPSPTGAFSAPAPGQLQPRPLPQHGGPAQPVRLAPARSSR